MAEELRNCTNPPVYPAPGSGEDPPGVNVTESAGGIPAGGDFTFLTSQFAVELPPTCKYLGCAVEAQFAAVVLTAEITVEGMTESMSWAYFPAGPGFPAGHYGSIGIYRNGIPGVHADNSYGIYLLLSAEDFAARGLCENPQHRFNRSYCSYGILNTGAGAAAISPPLPQCHLFRFNPTEGLDFTVPAYRTIVRPGGELEGVVGTMRITSPAFCPYCDLTPVGEFWCIARNTHDWKYVEKRGYNSTPTPFDAIAGPFVIARAPCPNTGGESNDPSYNRETKQSEIEEAVRLEAESACSLTPLWCYRWQDYALTAQWLLDGTGPQYEKVGEPYQGWGSYAEPDAAVGYESPTFEPIEIERLAAIRDDVPPYYLPVPDVAGKPIVRRFTITDGPFQIKDYQCRNCPRCGHVNDYKHCRCGLRPVLQSFYWDPANGEPPEGYDPISEWQTAVEEWQDECVAPALVEKAGPFRKIPGPVNDEITFSGTVPVLPDDVAFLWKLPVQFFVVPAAAPAYLGVVKRAALGLPQFYLKGPIEGPAVIREAGDELSGGVGFAASLRAAAEDAFQADLESTLPGLLNGPWWCCTYQELDSEGADVGATYQGCAEVRTKPGDPEAGAEPGDVEVVPLGVEGPHYPGAVERRRTLGPHYWLGAGGGNSPGGDCQKRCPDCGQGAPPVSAAGGGSGMMMMTAASRPPSTATARSASPKPKPAYFALPLAELTPAQRTLKLARCDHLGVKLPGQSCGSTLYRCGYDGVQCNTQRPCDASDRCCQTCPHNTALAPDPGAGRPHGDRPEVP